MSRHPRLGIAVQETYSVCRMVNIDKRSPKLHSSVSVIRNDQTSRTLHLGMHVMNGVVEYLAQNSCDVGTPRFMDIVEFYTGVMEGSGDEMTLLCQESISREEVLNFMTYEILEHALGRPSEIRRGVGKLMERCFGNA